ncbi:hypothetical protein NSED_07620 [Candidatus Nitrosopumilus sediminis]|uniref:Uncharacterized protein n=1 Tax=Candidatus Nitrosopumilus sediminis TaxID=1229909 RepID=K0BGA3_9ARCH|nr:hypothetical protein NSED_07620 [Candidatus Nitrosopumilus sediminis]
MHCNESCKKFKAESNGQKSGRYVQGQKRCTQCELFITWEGLWCPCCGCLLRSKPRARKLKQRLSLQLSR